MKFISHSVKETLEFGAAIASKLEKGDIICLFGQLGSGKTVLTKGLAQGLGIKKDDVTSPSFVLLRLYEADCRLPLYHFDLYRLKELKDIMEIGYEEFIFGKGVSVVEWAEKFKQLLPKEFLKIGLSVKGDKIREFKLSALGNHYVRLLEEIHEYSRD